MIAQRSCSCDACDACDANNWKPWEEVPEMSCNLRRPSNPSLGISAHFVSIFSRGRSSMTKFAAPSKLSFSSPKSQKPSSPASIGSATSWSCSFSQSESDLTDLTMSQSCPMSSAKNPAKNPPSIHSCAMFGGRKGKGKGKAQAAPKSSSWAIQGGAAEKIIVAEPPNKRRKGGSAVLGENRRIWTVIWYVVYII